MAGAGIQLYVLFADLSKVSVGLRKSGSQLSTSPSKGLYARHLKLFSDIWALFYLFSCIVSTFLRQRTAKQFSSSEILCIPAVSSQILFIGKWCGGRGKARTAEKQTEQVLYVAENN
jgi:hypothetical protein